jgi:hypothetical protein
MVHWDFDEGPDEDAWTWTCSDSDTGQVVRRSTHTFATLRECVLDAVREQVDDLTTDAVEYTDSPTPTDAEIVAMEEELGRLLDKAVARRELLVRLLARAQGKGDKPQVGDIERRLSELDGAIALVTVGVTKH